MKNSANPEEILVRAGGDEFYLFRMVEDQLTGKEEERILDRVIRFQNALREEELNSGKPYRVSASIGCAYGTVHDRAGIEELLRDADRRMYIDKAAKKFV
jgi:GGDEF domain-containing protein